MSKNFSEQTLLKVLVNLKCLGYMGKCVRGFSRNDKGKILDELIKRGYIDENCSVLPSSLEIVKSNLNLCER